MKFLRNIAIGISVMFLSLSANAEYLGDLGDVTEQSVFGFSNDVESEFTDTGNFSLTETTDVFALLFSFSFSEPDNLISDFVVTISNSLGETMSWEVSDFLVFTTGTLSQADYTVLLSGNAGFGGTYDLSIAQVSAVPEASTFALMLSGMGIVAFAARKRRKL